MKITFMSKAGLLLTQALVLFSSLQAVPDKGIKGIQHKHNNSNLEHLYAFNDPGNDQLTTVLVGEDVPFNNGNSEFPPTPLVKGKGINQLDNTDFLIYKNGDYLVTFYGYVVGLGGLNAGVQLFVNDAPTGPAVILNTVPKILSFSQTIQILGASPLNPAVVEVRVVAVNLTTFGLVFQSTFPSSAVNTTLEIVKLSSLD